MRDLLCYPADMLYLKDLKKLRAKKGGLKTGDLLELKQSCHPDRGFILDYGELVVHGHAFKDSTSLKLVCSVCREPFMEIRVNARDGDGICKCTSEALDKLIYKFGFRQGHLFQQCIQCLMYVRRYKIAEEELLSGSILEY